MRIGIEAQRIFRTKKHGMDIYALKLIEALMQLDHTNEYFVFVRPGKDRCLRTAPNFTIVEIKALNYLDWEQVHLPRKIRSLNLDLLHCTSNTGPVFSSVPYLVTLHDIIFLTNGFAGGSTYQRLGHHYRKWVVPTVFRNAARVITVSNFEKNTILNRLKANQPVEVIYNGVDARAAQPDPDMPLAELPDQYIFFLGNSAPKKNMKGFLKSYQRYRAHTVKPLPLVIAETSFQEVARTGRLEGEILRDIHCTGYLPQQLLFQVYARASLFVYPSFRESFGIPIIEAMRMGVPVITSNTSSMPEVAGGAAILVDPYDPDDIAESIRNVLQNPQLKADLIARGFQNVARFSWTAGARQTLTLYESCVRNQSQAA